jgi:hypothetical protein
LFEVDLFWLDTLIPVVLPRLETPLVLVLDMLKTCGEFDLIHIFKSFKGRQVTWGHVWEHGG